MEIAFNCIKPQRNWMNARSCPAVPIRGKAGTPSGHANVVVEINDFRLSEGVEIPFPKVAVNFTSLVSVTTKLSYTLMKRTEFP